jgi:hypothetical protein
MSTVLPVAVHCDSPTQPPEKAIDAKTLAPIINCDISTVHEMARAGLIPSILVGRRQGGRRFFLNEVKRALAERSAHPVSTKARGRK